MAAAAFLLCVLTSPADAQRLLIGDPWEDYARVLGLLGRGTPMSWVIRPLSVDQAFSGTGGRDHPWRARQPEPRAAGAPNALGAISEPATLRLFVNPAFPAGQNDGAVWQGRGLTAALAGGVEVRYGPLTVAIRPELIYARNAPFPLIAVTDTSRTDYANPWHPRGRGPSIDSPQRFGPDPLWTLDPGQSFVRLDWRGAAVGASTGNLWWGPAVDNPILMSNNAPGFPHAFLATGRPISVGIGRVEAQWIWGWLTGSGWSARAGADSTRFATGLVASLAPGVLPNLTLGGARVFYMHAPTGGLRLRDYLLVFQGITKQGLAEPDNPLGNDARDQLLSLFARWAFPASGFEVYGEWARNDHNWDLRDFVLEPEHSQGYTLGFQRVMPAVAGRMVRLRGELTHLERDATLQVRDTPTYYTHHVVREGYTQRGQVIGAGIGPGGDAQRLALDVFSRWGRAGAFIGRQVHDNDAYYRYAADSGFTFNRHHVELQLGASALVFRGPWDLHGAVVWARHLNRDFTLLNDLTNLRFELSATWRPGVRRGPPS